MTSTKCFSGAMREASRALLACSFLLFSSLGMAANDNSPVTLPDEPMATTGIVPINMMLLADDSGSMNWTHAPEGIGDVERACWRGADGIAGGVMLCTPSDPSCHTIDVCGYPYPNPYRTCDSAGVVCTINPEEAKKKAATVLSPPLAAYGFNNLAYNPENIYRPPVFINEDGDEVNFPSMKDVSNGWTKVGWPEEFEGIERPAGVPVTLNFRDIQTLYKNERTYKADQRYALGQRYMASAPQEQKNELEKLTDVATPIHYFRTSVKWCKYYQSKSATPDGNPATPAAYDEGVLFIGSASPEACQKERTDEYKYPYYYHLYGEHYSPSRESHLKYPSFTLTVLDYKNPSPNEVKYSALEKDENGNLKVVEKTRSYADELNNYANWYAYYSNRTAATRTVATFALAGIDKDKADGEDKKLLRVGFTRLNDTEINKPIEFYGSDSSIANKNKYEIFKKLLEQNGEDPARNFGTPLKTGVDRVREAFAEKNDFLIYACQRNYTIALTDGVWNDDDFTGVGNQDNTVAKNPPTSKPVRVLGMDLIAGATWPLPLHEGDTSANTLADVSLYAWLNELKTFPVDYNVDLTDQDPALWRHMNLISLAYGAEGELLAKRSQDELLDAICKEEEQWPKPVKNESTTVDDLWHATLTGFGSFTASTNPADYDLAIENGSNKYQQGIDAIRNRGGTYSEAGVPITRDLDSTDGVAYHASFNPGWSGELVKRKVVENFNTGAVQWEAAQRLAASLAGSPTAWQDSRKVFTAKFDDPLHPEGIGIPFAHANLAEAQLQTLSANETEQQDLIAYLRGDTSLEINGLCGGGKYRPRTGPLGDFTRSTPVVIEEPGHPLYDKETDQGYDEFVRDNKSRKRVIYVAGNDGMLHAFDDEGEERWAFIPPELFRSKEDKGIVNLALPPDAGDVWKHYYYIDTTPRVIDVDLNSGDNGENAPDWRTLLVGGMGKGGTGYYALDVTDPFASNVENGDSYMWTFTDENMGYTFGRALMVKINAAEYAKKDSDGNLLKNTDGELVSKKWVAILPSGINNAPGLGLLPKVGDVENEKGDGKGCIFFVDLRNGKPLDELELCTSEGTPEEPIGLAYIRAYVRDASDQTALQVYGGDQLGNVWRFDISSQDTENWRVDKLAELTDPEGRPQPINTEPRFELTDGKAGEMQERWIMVGTGRFYDSGDVYDHETGRYSELTHSMYAINDGYDRTPSDGSAFPFRPRAAGSGFVNVTNIAVPGLDPGDNGWFEDLERGFQIMTSPDSLSGAMTFAANRFVPPLEQKNPCTTSSFVTRLYARDVDSGWSLFNNNGRTYEEFDVGLTTAKFVTRGGKVNIMAVTAEQEQRTHLIDASPLIRSGGGGVAGSGNRRSSIRYIQ